MRVKVRQANGTVEEVEVKCACGAEPTAVISSKGQAWGDCHRCFQRKLREAITRELTGRVS